MALSETLKDLTEGIASLRNQTYELGDRYMQGENIMKDGMDLRNMLKNMDIEITKLEGTSRKDNPSVYDVEVEQYTSDEAGKLKNRLGELMNATSDFEEAPGMFDGGMPTGVIGAPVSVEKLDEPITPADIIKQDYSDPMLRLISGQRAGFYPHLGFGADPYADIFRQALYGTPEQTPAPTPAPYTPPPDEPPFEDPRDGDFYDPRDYREDYLIEEYFRPVGGSGIGSLGSMGTVGGMGTGEGFGNVFGGVRDVVGGVGDFIGNAVGGIGDLLSGGSGGGGMNNKFLNYLIFGPLGGLALDVLGNKSQEAIDDILSVAQIGE